MLVLKEYVKCGFRKRAKEMLFDLISYHFVKKLSARSHFFFHINVICMIIKRLFLKPLIRKWYLYLLFRWIIFKRKFLFCFIDKIYLSHILNIIFGLNACEVDKLIEPHHRQHDDWFLFNLRHRSPDISIWLSYLGTSNMVKKII